MISSSILYHRKFNNTGSAFTFFAIDFKLSVVNGDDSIYKGKAKAGTGNGACIRAAIKRRANLVQFTTGDSYTKISNCYGDFFWFAGEGNLYFIVGIFIGIVEYIQESGL